MKKANAKIIKLFRTGSCVKAGIVRGDVSVVPIPQQSPANDVVMRQLSGILYGNTKFTDEQIVYFYNKHDGNVSAASRDIRMSYLAFRSRLPRLGLEPKGRPGTNQKKWYSDAVITKAMNDTDNNIAQAAKKLGCSRVTMRKRVKELGIKTHGRGRRKS